MWGQADESRIEGLDGLRLVLKESLYRQDLMSLALHTSDIPFLN